MKKAPMHAIKKAYLKVLYDQTVAKKEYHPFFILRLQAAKKFLPANFAPNVEDIKLAISELVRDGYIKPIGNRYLITKKGLEQTFKPFDKMQLPTMDLVPLIASNYRLMKAVYNDYIEGDFESVVFKAYKLLEERVREKAELTAADYGRDLMKSAFLPNVGHLICPNTKTNSEQDALCDLMKGAIGFYKNPKSHRTVVIEDPDKVIKMVALASLLIDTVNECQLRATTEANS